MYRGKISYTLPFLFFPILITLVLSLDNLLSESTMIAWLVSTWILFLAFISIPAFFRLKVGESEISIDFMGFNLHKIDSLHIQKINYGGMQLWGSLYGRGPIHGKGLAVLMTTRDGSTKIVGISEKMYGKEAIAHIQKVVWPINVENKDNKQESLDDKKGNCKQCGHPLNPHILIAIDKDDLTKGGIIKCPVLECTCHSTWDFTSSKPQS